VNTLLTLVWLYAIQRGERSLFTAHIDVCHWEHWEKWPAEAAPHRLVLIADPQLVDPHTYPGRPWPLSSLTESYTDMYMARNFRLINANFNPDNIIFLGDLLDGGREWATSKVRPSKEHQEPKVEAPGNINSGKPTGKREESGKIEKEEDRKDNTPEPESAALLTGNSGGKVLKRKRSEESYKAAVAKPHDHMVSKKDHNLNDDGDDLKAFVYGENGRWKKWGQPQWDTDFARFGHIFLDHDQLYPHTDRRAFPAYEVPADPVTALNGAPNITWREYATAGGKARRVIMSLPGNHDLGFGDGVQLAVRDRFQSHFGETNRIDVVGNHTIVSLDAPSLSASGQYVREGGETRPERVTQLKHIWKPTMDFLDNIRTGADKVVADALHEYFPDDHKKQGYIHAVTSPEERNLPTRDESAFARSKVHPELPVILLTHVPLYRDPNTDCGRLREKGRAISVSAGYQYQNVLTQSLSNTVINRVSAAGDIAVVFSGDDHDYCDVTHRYSVETPGTKGTRLQSIREITVKSFSWAMGVRKPGFLLVSLWNPVDAMGDTVGTPLPTIQTHLCLLPDQLTIFIDYALLLGATLLILLLRAVVLALRGTLTPESGDSVESPASRLVLPRFQTKPDTTQDHPPSMNRYPGPNGRQRASSTSTSNHNSNGNLGVQRSHTARTRSVSPAAGYNAGGSGGSHTLSNSPAHSRPLIEKAGYYPQVRWTDPDDDSDEESHLGDGLEEDDSQAKWKRRRRTPSKARQAVDEFLVSALVVGLPSGGFYFWLIWNG